VLRACAQQNTATTNAWQRRNASCLVLRVNTSGLELQCIFRKPRIFMHVLIILKCVYEIAALSCYFLFMQKVEKAKTKGEYFQNLESH